MLKQPDVKPCLSVINESQWWRGMVDGDMDMLMGSAKPREGYYQARMADDAPWQPVRIWSERPHNSGFWRMHAEASVSLVDPASIWPACVPITREQWQALHVMERRL